MFQQIVKSLAEKENVTESLKTKDMMLWVQKMNNIRHRATEIVNTEVIFVRKISYLSYIGRKKTNNQEPYFREKHTYLGGQIYGLC